MQTSFTLAQLADPDISEADKILRACVHCGFCTATCPTYVLLGDELDSPRGRIYLIKDMLENDRPATGEVVKHIDRCLSCLACMTTCPSGVHYMHLVDHARGHIERTYTRPLADRLLRALLARVLPYNGRFRRALNAARLGKPFAGLFGMLGLEPVAAMLRLAPARPLAGATGQGRRRFSPAGPRRGRIALLDGCVGPVLAPSINAAAIRLLTRHGIEVVLAGEGCCGSLVHHMGREGQAHAQARASIDKWTQEIENAGLDAIIVTASGCGTTIKDYGFMLRGDPDYADKAVRISGLTRDISEYLAELRLGVPVQRIDVKVAYQSACSLQHGQKIHRQPKDLLAAAGFRVSDVAEPHLCCGSAGTYNMMQPDIAATLRDRKIANIERTAADVIASGNIGCMTQLAPATAIPVAHTVELLDWAYGGPMPEALAHVRNRANDSRRITNAT